MSYDEDHIAMAAEYVLGTLDGDERAQVESMMSIDPAFRQVVEQWERKLGELHAMVGAVEPTDEVWRKIRTAVTAIAPEAAMRLPEVTSVPAAAPPSPEIGPDTSNVVALPTGSNRWRSLAQLTTALAACLAAFIAVQAYRPDLLPEKLRPPAKVEYVQVTPPQSAQFVAVFQRDGGLPAFIMTIDTRTKEFTVRKATTDAPAGRSYELWMVSDRFTQPRSLGIIGATDFTTKANLTSLDDGTIHGATYAVTVEPEGGSPTGQPTTAPIYAGKLIEIVPAASTPPPPAKK